MLLRSSELSKRYAIASANCFGDPASTTSPVIPCCTTSRLPPTSVTTHGNPQAIAELQPGERVLDLGSGAGFDAFLIGEGEEMIVEAFSWRRLMI